MRQQPFHILKPFSDRLRVAIAQKGDSTDLHELQKNLGISTIIRPKQMHGTRTVVITNIPTEPIEADGVITDHPGIGLAISWADCQNFVVYAPEKHILGVMHVGWRGLRDGMIPSFFRALRERFGVAPNETIVAAGPSLCGDCAEFSDPKKELAGMPERFFRGRLADLPAIADWQLQKLGVPPGHCERMPDCTKESPEKFWTYRGGDREAVMKGKTNVLLAILL